jgi:hypothetical protein
MYHEQASQRERDQKDQAVPAHNNGWTVRRDNIDQSHIESVIRLAQTVHLIPAFSSSYVEEIVFPMVSGDTRMGIPTGCESKSIGNRRCKNAETRVDTVHQSDLLLHKEECGTATLCHLCIMRLLSIG